jgi:hypothetical protein
VLSVSSVNLPALQKVEINKGAVRRARISTLENLLVKAKN